VAIKLDYGRNKPAAPRFSGKRIATATGMIFSGSVAASLLAGACVCFVRGSQWAILLGCVGGAAGGVFIALWRDLRRQIRESSA
jgi:hypothetical protein